MKSMTALVLLALTSFPLIATVYPVAEVMAVRAGIGPAMRTRDRAALEKRCPPGTPRQVMPREEGSFRTPRLAGRLNCDAG
jgi:hypothetical protein